MLDAQSIYGKLIIASNMRGAGLGNRMRFTLSALSLANATGRKFKYVWPKDETFTPTLNQLWEFKESMISEEDAQKLCESLYCCVKYEDLPYSCDTMPIWYFNSHQIISLPAHLSGLSWGDYLRDLRPVASISERIEVFYSQYLIGKPFIGVMIRTHNKAHPKTLGASPIEWYITRMTELSNRYPDISFFCQVTQ